MNEEKEYGFTLTLKFKKFDASHEECLFQWLQNYSLLEKFHENVLFVQPSKDSTVIIVFDSLTNCFEVMQEVNCHRDMYHVEYEVTGIEVIKCNTKLSVLELLPSYTSPFFNIKTLKKHLEQFGLLLSISPEKKNGFRTGVIRALMVLKDESKIPQTNEQHGVFKIVSYLPHMFDLWYEETTKKLYDDFCSYISKKRIEAEEENCD